MYQMESSSTAQIIKLVRLNTFLFDYKHSDYRNVQKKEETWNCIGASVGMSGENAKKKWKNVRDNYAKFCRAIGTPKSDNYVQRFKSWHWGDEMAFLKPFLQPARTSKGGHNHSSKSQRRSEIKSSGEDSDLNQTSWFEDDTENNSNNESVNVSVKAEEETNEYDGPVEYEWQQSTKHNKRKFEQPDETYMQMMNVDKKQDDGHTYDDIDLICLGYAKTIKKFSPRRQAIIKFKIARLIMEEELAQQSGNAEPQSDPFA